MPSLGTGTAPVHLLIVGISTLEPQHTIHWSESLEAMQHYVEEHHSDTNTSLLSAQNAKTSMT